MSTLHPRQIAHRHDVHTKYTAWIVERQLQVNCNAKDLWNIFENVEGWNKWDPDLDYAELEEIPNKPSLEGATGTVHMKNNAGSYKFKLHDLDPNGYVAYTTPLTGAVLDWYWSYSETTKGGNLILKEGIKATGFLSYVYKMLFASRVAIAFEQALVNLKQLCESKQGARLPVSVDAGHIVRRTRTQMPIQ